MQKKLLFILLSFVLVSLLLCACTTQEQARSNIDKSTYEYNKAKDKLEDLQNELEDVQNQIDNYR